MERRSLAEDRVQRGRVHRGDPGGVEVAEPALQVGRSAERLLDGHLLVEREPDQQRQRFVDEQAVGIGVAGERERGRASSWAHGTRSDAREPPAYQVIRLVRPLARPAGAHGDDEPAGQHEHRRRADVDEQRRPAASDSGAATTEPSIRKLIVRPSRCGSVRACVHEMIETLR